MAILFAFTFSLCLSLLRAQIPCYGGIAGVNYEGGLGFGTGTCQTGAADGSKCQITCPTGNTLTSGSFNVTCVNGTWTTPSAVCGVPIPQSHTTCTNSITISGSMEGAMTAHPGDWVNYGWHYSTNVPASLTWVNPTGTLYYNCQGSSQTQSYTFTYQTTTFAAAGGVQVGGGNENIVWPPGFSVQLPPLCGEGNPIPTSKGAQFHATVLTNVSTCLQFQFHYRIPGAKGGTAGNVNLWQWCPLHNYQSSTCGASWSATPSGLCFNPQCVAAENVLGPSGPVAITGYVILILVVLGIAAFAVVYNARKSAQGRQSKENIMAQQQAEREAEDVDIATRPAAPSGASSETLGITVGQS